jgi:cytosine/adenosine deaminase-related metal-dependent hydrolase
MAVPGFVSDHASMNDTGLHHIEDDLGDGWLDSWTEAGVKAIEEYLAKHAAFLSFLESQEA